MENTQLTIADLASLHSLIDAACSRGAFKASEMQSIGGIYNKLTRFLEVAKQQAQVQAEQAEYTQGDQNA